MKLQLHITYNCKAWKTTNKSKIPEAQNMQNKFLKVIWHMLT
jgi:hypothetical protein